MSGYVMVPIEPTEEMLDAACDVRIIEAPAGWGKGATKLDYSEAQEIWSALLAVSPLAPTTAGEGLGPYATRIEGDMAPLDYLMGGMTYLRQGDSLIVLDEGMRASLAAALSRQAVP